MKQVIAKKAFISPADGSRAKGEVFYVKGDRALILARDGLVEVVPEKKTEPVAPVEVVYDGADEGQERQARKSKA